MLNTLELSLLALRGCPVEVVDDDAPEDAGEANVSIVFGNGTTLGARYWRLIRNDFVISSFDHGQKYGLPDALDAKRELQSHLQSKILTKASIDRSSGDLHFEFSDRSTLQVFAFTSYETWDILFTDGSTEYSNYARRPPS